jgi:hypothetical protein
MLTVLQVFGGLDICALDFLHGRDGKEYILELNGMRCWTNN